MNENKCCLLLNKIIFNNSIIIIDVYVVSKENLFYSNTLIILQISILCYSKNRIKCFRLKDN